MVAALLSKLVLIPVTPSPLDIWAAEKAVELVREARKERGGVLPRSALVPSRLITGTLLAREIHETLMRLGEPIAPPITQRVAVVEAAVAGTTLTRYAPRSAAYREFTELANYVLKKLSKT